MAGRRKVQAPPNDPTLTADYWLQYSPNPEPTVRNKLLYLAIEEVGKQGPSEFNSVRICDRLAVSASLINHYFGGRDGLIAEATAIAYKAYVLGLRDLAVEKLPNAREALKAWMYGQIHWHQKHPGVSEVLNYPKAHTNVSHLINRDFQREITKYYEFNVSVITRLLIAIRDNTVEMLADGPDDYDRATLIADPAIRHAVAIGWATLGAAVWAAGGHIPSSETPETEPLYRNMLDRYIEILVESISEQISMKT